MVRTKSYTTNTKNTTKNDASYHTYTSQTTPTQMPVPVYDYRANKNGAAVPNAKIHGVPKCVADGKGACAPLDRTPHNPRQGLHGGVLIKENGKDKIVYH